MIAIDSKNELMDMVWPKLVVEANNLEVQIVALRKLLGYAAIATVPERGDRISTQIEMDGDGSSPATTHRPAYRRAHGNLPGSAPALFGRDEDTAARRELGLTTLGNALVAGCGRHRQDSTSAECCK